MCDVCSVCMVDRLEASCADGNGAGAAYGMVYTAMGMVILPRLSEVGTYLVCYDVTAVNGFMCTRFWISSIMRFCWGCGWGLLVLRSWCLP